MDVPGEAAYSPGSGAINVTWATPASNMSNEEEYQTSTSALGNRNVPKMDENTDDSSIIDSDQDCETVPSPSQIREIVNSISLINGNCGEDVYSNPVGSVNIKDSSDITFGNKSFYQAPVTVKQFICVNKKWTDTGQTIVNPAITHNCVVHLSGDENAKMTKDQKFDHASDGGIKWAESKEKVHLVRWTSLITVGTTTAILLLAAAYLAVNVSVPTCSTTGSGTSQSKETASKEETTLDRWKILIVVSIATAASIVTIIITIKFSIIRSVQNKPSIGDGDDSRYNIPIDSNISKDIIMDPFGPLRFISRREWIAQPPEDTLTPLVLPSTRVIIAHTATESCSTQAACTFQVRMIQTFHIESRHWDDIAYNFLVGGDGCVYEGRGWDSQGAHTKGYNVKTIGLAFIGTFNKFVPPQRQIHAALNLLNEGVRLKKLDPNYRLYGHRQLIPSESPGSALYEIIKEWPHWSEEIVKIP